MLLNINNSIKNKKIKICALIASFYIQVSSPTSEEFQTNYCTHKLQLQYFKNNSSTEFIGPSQIQREQANDRGQQGKLDYRNCQF